MQITEDIIRFEERIRRKTSSRVHIGLVLTKYCPVGCKHCISNSPNSTYKKPDTNTLCNWIYQIGETRQYQVINITGGEPFAVYKELLRIIEEIQAQGMYATVVTSGFWAVNEKITHKLMKQTVDKGLFAIAVSVDKFHQEYIPIENVQRIICEAKRTGLRVKILSTYMSGSQDHNKIEEHIKTFIGEELMDGVQIRVGGIVRAGMAEYLSFPGSQRNKTKQNKMICNVIGLLIQEDGLVSCCCGPELSKTSPLIIGDLHRDTLFEIHNRFRQFFLIPFLEIWGLKKMLQELQKAGLAQHLKGYLHSSPELMCELCKKLLEEEKHISFFNSKYSNPDILRELAVKAFLIDGNPDYLLNLE